MKNGDYIVIEKPEVFQVIGQVNSVTPEKIRILSVGYLDRQTNTFYLKKKYGNREEVAIEGCSVDTSDRGRSLLESHKYITLLRDEIYCFFNNDPNSDHLDPKIVNNALIPLTTPELEEIVKIIIPHKRGEYGFSSIEQVKEQSKNPITLHLLAALIYYNGE